MSEEQWKPVFGYPGYEVSTYGRVRSYFRPGSGRLDNCPTLLKTRCQEYVSVHLAHYHVYRKVHRLVMDAFVGPPSGGCVIAHLDGDVRNNYLTNLQYVTQKENMAHRALHGNTAKGTHNGRSKLREEDVHAIRTKVAGGISMRSLAIEYDVHPTTIAQIIQGKTWKYLRQDVTDLGEAGCQASHRSQ